MSRRHQGDGKTNYKEYPESQSHNSPNYTSSFYTCTFLLCVRTFYRDVFSMEMGFFFNCNFFLYKHSPFSFPLFPSFLGGLWLPVSTHPLNLPPVLLPTPHLGDANVKEIPLDAENLF